MSHDVVLAEAGNELAAHAANIQRILALMVRRRAERVRRDAEQTAAQAAAIEHRNRVERQMAQPVWQLAQKDEFWKSATLEDSLMVYGLADRYAAEESIAALAKERAARELKTRFGFDPEAKAAEIAQLPPHQVVDVPQLGLLAHQAVTANNATLADLQRKEFLVDMLAQIEAEAPELLGDYEKVRHSDKSAAQTAKKGEEHQADVELGVDKAETRFAEADQVKEQSEPYDSKQRRAQDREDLAKKWGPDVATALAVTAVGRTQPVGSPITTEKRAVKPKKPRKQASAAKRTYSR